jgi:predicted permease
MVLVLTSISALVATALLLACLNIASILMALGARRATEFGLRLALGASSRQLYRQVLTESLLLSVAGTVAGFGTAVSVERLAAHLALPGGISLDRLDLHLSAHTLAFTAAVTIMTTLLIGILPARQAARASVAGAIRFRHQTVTSWRTVLLSAQMAISLAVLVGAGLFLRSVHAGLGADLGFAAKPLAILSARARLDGRHLDVIQPYMQMVKSASAVPGIQAALSSHVPLESTWQLPSFAGLPSAAPVSQNTPTMIGIESITPNYFRVLGVPLVSGREFDDRDTPVAQRVAIINETAARVLFPGQSALGKAITLGPVFTYTVVGIVRDTKYATLQDEAIPFAYQPMLQGDLRGRVHVVTRSDNPQRALEILRQLAKLNAPQLKSVRLELELDRIATVLHPQRVGALLLSVLALAALCIAAIGTYGSVAYLVSQRTTEIGIRLALGARSIDVTILVLQQCGVALASGIICGVVISAVAGRFVAHFLFEVQPMDIVALFGAVAVLSVTSLIAAAAPVLRALRIDPVSAMRSVD